MVDCFYEQEKNREREAWRRTAFLASQIINISGKMVKRAIKPEQLVRFAEEGKRAEEDLDKLKQEALAGLKFHKSKFWGAVGGTSLDKVKIYGEN